MDPDLTVDIDSAVHRGAPVEAHAPIVEHVDADIRAMHAPGTPAAGAPQSHGTLGAMPTRNPTPHAT